MINAYLTALTIPGAPAIGENPLPRFRDQSRHLSLTSDGTLPPETLEGAGQELAFRVLPYRMQDVYSRSRDLSSTPAVVLENGLIRATFLPDFGGRLYSLYSKKLGRELLFCNPVIQPANIALRDAWLSGGIEWNLGRTGHTYHTCDRVFFKRCKGSDGSVFLRMFEYDRIEGMTYQIDFHLPEGSHALYADVTLHNNQPHDIPMYWWTNIAVGLTKGTRVLSSTDRVIYQYPGKGFGLGTLPALEGISGDPSFPARFDWSAEYFFQTPDDVKTPWEAAVYPEEGWAFCEYSTDLLRYRKMFTWGEHRGGQVWRDYLSDPGKGDYIEIQGGIARTQLHGLTMPAGATWRFTQAFTGIAADAAGLCDMSYQQAQSALAGQFERTFPTLPAATESETLTLGSGWGALEQLRRHKRGEAPLALEFPLESLGRAELPWLSLLQNGKLPANTASFMIGDDWMELLRRDGSLEAMAHLGVMLYEENRPAEALEAWQKSLPHPLSYRNLSLIKRAEGDAPAATELMEKAVALDASYPYMTEYVQLLLSQHEYQKCWTLLETLPDAAPDRLWLLRAESAWQTGRYTELEDMFARSYSCIREGETSITQLWFKWAEKTGQENQTVPPAHIDFRMG